MVGKEVAAAMEMMVVVGGGVVVPVLTGDGQSSITMHRRAIFIRKRIVFT